MDLSGKCALQESVVFNEELDQGYIRTFGLDTFEGRVFTEGEGTLCWIDPHICHLFSEPMNVVNYLNYLSIQKFVKDPFLALPGCWEPQVTSISTPHVGDSVGRSCSVTRSAYSV